jgi:2-haloacid dehalogenase
MSRDWVTFDCYGTLADWLGGMRNALTPHVGAEDAERLLHAYHDLEAQVEAQRPVLSYREVLTETLRRAAEREGVALPAGAEFALVDHWHELPIFEDVGPALGALRMNGWSLAILSNCDDDLLAKTLERMPVPFDLTVTAEQVGSYKPEPGHWHGFEARTDGDRGRWVHAAQSWFHDIKTAAELGLPRVWVDRLDSGEDASLATVRITELGQLPEAVELAAGSSRSS